MSTKNVICILANDLDIFPIITSTIKQENYDVIVINDTRIGNKIDDLKQIYPNATYIDGMNMIDEFRTDIYDSIVLSYPLVLKWLIPWYIFKHYQYDKLFLLDDDIVLSDNFHNLFDLYEHGACYSLPIYKSSTSEDDISYKMYQDLFELFNIPSKAYCRINGGNILFNRSDITTNKYTDMLITFMKNQYVIEMVNYIVDKKRSYRSFTLDEAFLTMFAVKNDYTSLNKEICLVMNKADKVDYDKLVKTYNKKSLVHIVTRINKLNVLQTLKSKI